MLSTKTINWLKNINNASGHVPDEDIISELEPYKPQNVVKLFRGMNWIDLETFQRKTNSTYFPNKYGDIIQFNTGFHWTFSASIAAEFSALPDFGLLIEGYAEPDDIIVEINLLPRDVLAELEWIDEDEVILKNNIHSVVIGFSTPKNFTNN